MKLSPDTVRGPIRDHIAACAHALGTDVLEIGARMDAPGQWWIDNRPFASGQWTTCDMQPGHNVDRVVDMHAPPEDFLGRFTGIVCSEVLEHVERPAQLLAALHRCLKPGGLLVFTIPFNFPEHMYPSDYRRWTVHGIRVDLEDAGFTQVDAAYVGPYTITLNDHGERGRAVRTCFRHVVGTAVRP